MAEDVCASVAHRQVVLTIPKRLRLHTRFDRKLLGKLCACAGTCLQAEVGLFLSVEANSNTLGWAFHRTCAATRRIVPPR